MTRLLDAIVADVAAAEADLSAFLTANNGDPGATWPAPIAQALAAKRDALAALTRELAQHPEGVGYVAGAVARQPDMVAIHARGVVAPLDENARGRAALLAIGAEITTRSPRSRSRK